MSAKVKKHYWVKLGVAAWMSFLSASIATMLFFGTFDPVELVKVATFPFELGRSSGYSIGFLLFWLLLFANSIAVLWLADRKPN